MVGRIANGENVGEGARKDEKCRKEVGKGNKEFGSMVSVGNNGEQWERLGNKRNGWGRLGKLSKLTQWKGKMGGEG